MFYNNWQKKRTLIISPLPPSFCGVASYARDHFLKLKSAGHVVYSLSPYADSGANYRADLTRFSGLLKAFVITILYSWDNVILHFNDGIVWPKPQSRFAGYYLTKIFQVLWIGMLGLRYGKRFVLVAHEISLGKRKNIAWKWIRSLCGFALVRNIEFHTAKERSDFLKYFFGVRAKHATVVSHTRYMTPQFSGTRAEARAAVGVQSPCGRVFLCIGFVKKHKGFEDVMRATRLLSRDDKLYVVGSFEEKDWEYRRDFLELVATLPRVSFVEGKVSDELFDTWLAAADLVILPYLEIWSSGVGARAELMKARILARDLPYLRDQFASYAKASFFKDSDDLVKQLDSAPSTNPAEIVGSNLETYGHLRGRRLLFIMSWFGPKIHGGAENFIFQLCHQLALSGAKVEMWSTASSGLAGWNQDFMNEDIRGLSFTIRRFQTQTWTERIFHRVHRRMNKEGHTCPILQLLWNYSNLYGYGMKEALLKEESRFDSIHICHYLSGTSHRLSGVVPEKTILHPFIHNEAPLRKSIMRHFFAGARGVLCNSEAERYLAGEAYCGLLPQLYQPIGNGVERSAEVESLTAFDRVDELRKRGFVLYIGRFVPGKNLGELFSWHRNAFQSDAQFPYLLLIGDGELKTSPDISREHGIINLGFLSEAEKQYAISHSLTLVQPSLLESFSLVIMEAWLARVPVIVHRDCMATRVHCERSQGGTSVFDLKTYADAVSAIRENPKLREKQGAHGFDYVQNNFTWARVCQNFALRSDEILRQS